MTVTKSNGSDRQILVASAGSPTGKSPQIPSQLQPFKVLGEGFGQHHSKVSFLFLLSGRDVFVL